MVKKTIVEEATDELKKDIDIIERARDKKKKTEGLGFKLSNRIGGLKIALWIVFGYLTYNVYSYTPLKNNLNEIFEEDFF